jgi:2-polyprenyl-3-methyl-5-hydroxy-6-metoxy-1,4-benzoquinol methylase
MKTALDQEWPTDSLEQVNFCPFCNSNQRTLAYGAAQDWSFGCAPGKWNYWDCTVCKSLYLDPRPTQSTIGLAYAKYYTHATHEPGSILHILKTRLRNECLSHLLHADLKPSLHLPKLLNGLLTSISKRVSVPFGWMELAKLPKGRFIDVGCGGGLSVGIAQQLGWDAMGLELDPVAVNEAQRNGLNILEGSYEQLAHYPSQFDCIMSSHVLEHVHDPLDMLTKIKASLKPGGIFLLTLPNSLSALRFHFGANWRGLEAPRHLAIPSQTRLAELLKELGFTVDSQADNDPATAAESFRITRRDLVTNRHDVVMARKLNINPLAQSTGNDFIKFVCQAPLGKSE